MPYSRLRIDHAYQGYSYVDSHILQVPDFNSKTSATNPAASAPRSVFRAAFTTTIDEPWRAITAAGKSFVRAIETELEQPRLLRGTDDVAIWHEGRRNAVIGLIVGGEPGVIRLDADGQAEALRHASPAV
jgi:hypothetical protein